MQVTSLLSGKPERADLACDSCAEAVAHEHIPIKLSQTLIGAMFIVNAFAVEWLLGRGNMVAGASAMIGALILAYPIMLTAWRDLRRGQLTINELVAIAV